MNKFVAIVMAVLLGYFLYSTWYFEQILPQVLPEEVVPEDYFCDGPSFVPYVSRCCSEENGKGYCALFVD